LRFITARKEVDGFTVASLPRYHSADFDRDSKVSLSKLLRIIDTL